MGRMMGEETMEEQLNENNEESERKGKVFFRGGGRKREEYIWEKIKMKSEKGRRREQREKKGRS